MGDTFESFSNYMNSLPPKHDEWARSREIWQKYDYQTIMHSGGPYSQITFTAPLLEEDRDELLALGWQIRECRASKYIPWNTLWSQVGFTNITLGNNDTK